MYLAESTIVRVLLVISITTLIISLIIPTEMGP